MNCIVQNRIAAVLVKHRIVDKKVQALPQIGICVIAGISFVPRGVPAEHGDIRGVDRVAFLAHKGTLKFVPDTGHKLRHIGAGRNPAGQKNPFAAELCGKGPAARHKLFQRGQIAVCQLRVVGAARRIKRRLIVIIQVVIAVPVWALHSDKIAV